MELSNNPTLEEKLQFLKEAADADGCELGDYWNQIINLIDYNRHGDTIYLQYSRDDNNTFQQAIEAELNRIIKDIECNFKFVTEEVEEPPRKVKYTSLEYLG